MPDSKSLNPIKRLFAAILLACALPALGAAQSHASRHLSYPDLEYSANGHELQKLDLYVPNAPGPHPLIIWIHGGGWFAGDKSRCFPLQQGFIERGYAIASVNYRLTNDSIFPAPIEDCKAAIRWLRAHADKYQVHPDRFGVWGSSAGGHLAALVGTTSEIDSFETGEHLDVSSSVQAVCDYYGPTDFTQMDDHAVPGTKHRHNAENSPESRLIGGPIQAPEYKEKVQRANPIPYLSGDEPPFLIVHGDLDPVVAHHQSELLFTAMEQRKLAAQFITIQGGRHGGGFPHEELNPIVHSFFARFLKGENASGKWPLQKRSTLPATDPSQ